MDVISSMKKVLAVLLAVLFVVSLTAVAASAYHRHDHHQGGHWHHAVAIGAVAAGVIQDGTMALDAIIWAVY